VVTWNYSPATNAYARLIGGVPHVDKASHKQYSASNVVVMWALVQKYAAAGATSQVQEIQLTGTGRVTVFHDGQRVDGTWHASATAPPVLRDGAGNVIPLTAGTTWFQVIGNDQNISMR
jgi:hypothetical protein